MDECLEGGGCVAVHPDCPNELGGAGRDDDATDSGLEVYGVAGTSLGGTCGCEAGFGGGSAFLVLLVVVLIRRLAPALVVCALAFAGPARAQDIRSWIQLDGGPLPGFVEPSPQGRWAVRGALSAMRVADPVVLRTNRGLRDYVPFLDTLELAGSVRLASLFRVGASLPLVRTVAPEGTFLRLGVPAIFLLREVSDAVTLQIIVIWRQRNAPVWAHQPSYTFGFTGRQAIGFLDGLWRLQIRGQWPVMEIGGIVWGPRFEGALGVRTRGRVAAGAQLVASAPTQLVGVPPRGAWPVEAVGSLHVATSKGVAFDGLVGVGITRGLGSSRVRLGVGMRAAAVPEDTDLDRVIDARDACVDDPEDRDGFRDRDGCPDPDNDLDGFPDEADACPNRPETNNGYLDDDGCPDSLAPLTVAVSSTEPFERVYVAVDGEGGWHIDETQTFAVPPGLRKIIVIAERHETIERTVEVPETGTRIDVRMRPIVRAPCVVRVASADGTPLDATFASSQGTFPVSSSGASTFELPVGRHEGTLSAVGHLDEFVVLEVTRRDCVRAFTLDPRVPAPPISFAEDSSALSTGSRATLDALAAWLRSHPEVRLVRVTGHADDTGTPAYNYALSVRRARAVVDALADRGIAPARLTASGDGESRLELDVTDEVTVQPTDAPLREVRFSILVWDEATP